MGNQHSDQPAEWWMHNLDDLDHEIVRLASVCEVRILERGVIERILHKDASVCGRPNPVAFAKLRNLVIFHFAIRQQAADAIGQVRAAVIERYVIDALKAAFPDLLTDHRPA